jgi:hypothetical protein
MFSIVSGEEKDMGNQKPVRTGGKMVRAQHLDYTIEEIEKDRRHATQFGVVAIICFELLIWAIFATYHRLAEHSLWALLPSTGLLAAGWGMVDFTKFARYEFLNAYRKFYLRRYVEAVDLLEAEGYDLNRVTDKNAFGYWSFYRSTDLLQLEQSLFDYLRSFRRAEDLLRRQAKWAAANAKLTKQLEVFLDEFQIAGAKRQEILENFSSYDNPQRRKEYLEGLRSRITHERWVELNLIFTNASGVQLVRASPLVSEEDFRLKHLEAEASRVTSDLARRYYSAGLEEKTRHEKIRLFKRALNAEVIVSESLLATEGMTIKPSHPQTVAKEVKYLSLQDFARERLGDLCQYWQETDWQMCREIILALARPGQAGGRFNKHYFAEDTVKRMVRRQCSMYGDIRFEPSNFDKAVAWLLDRRVLLTKPKVDERTLSLSTKVKGAATPAAAHIASLVHQLKREVKGLPS